MSKKFVIAILALFIAGTAFGQQVATSKMEGKVLDSTGAPLPGVSIEATSPKLVGKAAAVTDETGTYRLFSLPSGTYTVTFTLQGFKPVKREGIILQLEQTLTLDIDPGAEHAGRGEVTVVGQSPLIDVKSTTKGQTMTKEMFMQLPRNRNFDGLLSTVPGVQYEGNQGGLSVDGASGTENMWYIDGTNITNIHIGTQAQSIVMEQLEEVKVTASGYNAEFGGSMGGVVNVISRSGGNEFHGDMFGYYNNNSSSGCRARSATTCRWSPYAYPLRGRIRQQRRPVLQRRQEPRRLQAVRGRLQPRRLHPQGQAVVLRLVQPGLLPHLRRPLVHVDPDCRCPVPATRLRPRQAASYNFYSKNWNWNGQAKLTAAPIKGMRMSVSAVNNFCKYRGAIPGISRRPAATDLDASWRASDAGKQPGFDYPNLVAATLTLDYTRQQQLPGQRPRRLLPAEHDQPAAFVPRHALSPSTRSNTCYRRRSSRPTCSHYAGWTNCAGTGRSPRRYKLRQAHQRQPRLDLLPQPGRRARLEGRRPVHPRCTRTSTQRPAAPHGQPVLGSVLLRPCARRHPTSCGTYGYYQIRTTPGPRPTANFWNIASNNWAIYLQDSWTIGEPADPELRRPDGERVHPVLRPPTIRS